MSNKYLNNIIIILTVALIQTLILTSFSYGQNTSKKKDFIPRMKSYDMSKVKNLKYPNKISPKAYGKKEEKISTNIPKQFRLAQNYPNPFNPSTTIEYDLKKYTKVNLKIYDILGRQVRTLVNEKQDAGTYKIKWDGKNSSGISVASGIYFYQIVASEFVQTKKMMVVK